MVQKVFEPLKFYCIFFHIVHEGEAAVRFLLNGARPIWARSRFHQRFEKQGDFKTALKDFYSVGPRDVHIEVAQRGVRKGVSLNLKSVGDTEEVLSC